jgi:hypothetical protein
LTSTPSVPFNPQPLIVWAEEDQKQLHGFLSEASEKLQEYKQQNPGVTKEDWIKNVAGNRATI